MSTTADGVCKLGWTHLNVYMRCLGVVFWVGECAGLELFTHSSCFLCRVQSIISCNSEVLFLPSISLPFLGTCGTVWERPWMLSCWVCFLVQHNHCKLIDFCTDIPVHGLLPSLPVHCCFLCSALLFIFILLLRTRPTSPSRLGKGSTSEWLSLVYFLKQLMLPTVTYIKSWESITL